MKVTKLLNKMPRCQKVQIILLSTNETKEVYNGKVEDVKGLTIEKLKVNDICTFSIDNDTITIYAIKR